MAVLITNRYENTKYEKGGTNYEYVRKYEMRKYEFVIRIFVPFRN
jgi:hypothetical protein